MKKLLLCFFVVIALLTLPAMAAPLELRGVWVSTVYDLDYPSAAGCSAAQLEAEADRIIETVRAWGMNAVFLQVRPSADAFYASETEPWSVYLSGKQGLPADGGFDPLDYFTRRCHENGLQLHAWINPYRITRRAASTREEALSQLCETHPALGMKDSVVFHEDGCLYYDPGRPQVRDMLLSVAEELLTRYEIDGLHMDDYFYPGQTFDDSQTYQTYGADFSTLGDFRRDAVNQLVASLAELTHRLRPQAVFGISPGGIWATRQSHPLGADTTGGQSYFDHYADSRKWVRENTVDYLIPQLYWEIGASSGDFETMLNWWADTSRDTDAALYIGLAAYRSTEAEPGSVWHGSDELSRQLAMIEASGTAKGVVFFRYRSLLGSDLAPLLAQRFFTAKKAALPQPQWPRTVTQLLPAHGQALAAGERLAVSCTAPRGSKVAALWRGGAPLLLRPDLRGNYSGSLPLERPSEKASESAPVLLCTEKNGMVFLRLSPKLSTAVSPDASAALIAAERADSQELHQLTLRLTGGIPADFRHSGDVITLRLKNCSLKADLEDDYFQHLSHAADSGDLVIRLVLPDDGARRSADLKWQPDRITLEISTDRPADPTAGP